MEALKFLMISTHFPPHHLGGDAVFVEYLSNELIRRGHEVHVFYNPSAYELLRRDKPALPGVRDDDGPLIHPYHSHFGRLDPLMALSLGRWRRAERRLTELERKIKPNVVHWHNSRGFIGIPFPFEGAVSLYTTHDYTPVCPRSNLLKPGMVLCDDPRWCTICCIRWGKPPQLWRTGKRRILRFPDSLKLLSPSEFMARRYRQEGVNVHRVLRGFVPDLGRNFDRVDGLNDSIIYLGLMERHKGVQTLLDAFIRSRYRQGFRLYMIGEGTFKERLLEQVRMSRLDERIVIPGFLSRTVVEDIRRNAVAQIVPSVWYENAPSVALEAFSLGIPVLASDIGGLREIVGPDSGSEVFPPGDADRLSDMLISLWEKREGLEERRRRARKSYETRFRPEIHVDEYLKIVESLP